MDDYVGAVCERLSGNTTVTISDAEVAADFPWLKKPDVKIFLASKGILTLVSEAATKCVVVPGFDLSAYGEFKSRGNSSLGARKLEL